jgi:RNA polymerase sigma factor (sigma-70 family)
MQDSSNSGHRKQTATQDDPVSVWIDRLREADEVAARRVWEHFSNRLFEIARKRLRADTRRVYDEEDAVQSMFRSICAGMTAGRFPDLRDRDSLWRLMLVVTAQKISNRHRFDQQQRRDIRRTLTDSIFTDSRGDDDLLHSREPTPEFAAELEETCERLFERLNDPDLKEIAVLRLEGYTDAEIAAKLDCSRRTIQRRMTMIRRHWEDLEPSVE